MSGQRVSICRIVVYVLSAADAAQINRRRTTGESIARRLAESVIQAAIEICGWPAGAQAHIGQPVVSGQEFPAMVVMAPIEGVDPLINLQVFLDGNDVFWARSVANDEEHCADGTWHWSRRET